MNNIEIVDTLVGMFPDWDKETLTLILEDNHYSLDASIEVILLMANDAPPAAPVSNDSSQVLVPSRTEEMPSVTLPDDFLRPPGWKTPAQREMEFSDEQLAILLQDELFQTELESQFGPGYVNNLFGAQRGGGSSGNTSGVFSTVNNVGARRRNTGNTSGQVGELDRSRSRSDSNPNNRALVGGGDPQDMGILKGLQGLGEDMRSMLGNVAARWTAAAGDGGKNTTGSTVEMRPLVGHSSASSLMAEDSDEEEEVIHFGSRHTEGEGESLLGGGYGKKTKAA